LPLLRKKGSTGDSQRRPALGSELNSAGETPLASHLSRCVSPTGARRAV